VQPYLLSTTYLRDRNRGIFTVPLFVSRTQKLIKFIIGASKQCFFMAYFFFFFFFFYFFFSSSSSLGAELPLVGSFGLLNDDLPL